jgi:ferredoxin-NADP reductase
MPPEIINWLQDVREHLRITRRRQALRQPGAGIDYTADRYQEVVRRLVSRLHPDRMRLRVLEIISETATTKTLRCERIDGPLPPFRAGQYVNVFVDVDGVLTSRPYSISSAPIGETEAEQKTLDLTVRDKPGGFVAPYLINEVRVGDALVTTGPAGNFYYEPLIDGDDLVFIAGGSGITPFMSIIRDTFGRRSEATPSLRVHLLYGSRVADDVIFGTELAELAAAHDNFSYATVISEPSSGYEGLSGLLDVDLIRDQIGDVSGKTFYLCGPGVMYDFCLDALGELGVPAHKIRRELYGPPVDVTKEPGWPDGLSADEIFEVQVVSLSPAKHALLREGQTIRAPAGEPLMNTLERYGIVVPAVCRTGACSACRIRLISGRVFMPACTGLREWDRDHGYIHACVSYPLQDLRIGL